MRILLFTMIILISLFSCNPGVEKKPVVEENTTRAKKDSIIYENEANFKSLKQLTFGGENAEAYWSFADDKLVFQRTDKKSGMNCDQIFWGEIPKGNAPFTFKMISNGKGKTTCSYFMPGDEDVIFSSTSLQHEVCPEGIDREKMKEYVWQIHPEFEIFVDNKNGGNLRQLTNNNYYDAEATVSPNGDLVVFTSNRTGDLELYTMNIDGSNIKQVTKGLGYDGGAFFSPDGKKLIFRASRPSTPEAIKKYKDLLSQNMVSPTEMELFVCNIDGSDLQQITKLGGANWAPYFHPSGEKIIFCSNHHTSGFPFNLFMINVDGSGLKQITFDKSFDSFPMFSHNGKYLVFSSNRNNGGTRDTNIFLAEWMD